MLDPAPQPEDRRGGAVAADRRGDAQEDGRAGGRAGQGGRLRLRRHRRVRRRAGQDVLLPGDEHAAAGRASGDRAGHRPRSGRADDPRRRRREARDQAGRREAFRLRGRDPHLRRGPVPQFPALDRAADALPAAGGDDQRRRDGARRHRRDRGLGDLAVLRSDDRQARHPCADARARDRGAGRCARCLCHRRHPQQHSVPCGADAAEALAAGQALDRLHRRGISRRASIRPRRKARRGRRSPRWRRRSIMCWASASAASPASGRTRR